MLDVGNSEDCTALLVAALPCIIGYGEIGRSLTEDRETKKDGNLYWEWIEAYTTEGYMEVVKYSNGTFSYSGLNPHSGCADSKWKELVERAAVRQSVARIEELISMFKNAVKVK